MITQHAPDGFDLIVDDASHFAVKSEISFWCLFEDHLRPGGIYVIEDWGTGYLADWPTVAEPGNRGAQLMSFVGSAVRGSAIA